MARRRELTLDRAVAAAPPFLLCAGKGGVGKTTVAAAAAMALAAAGERTLVFSTDPAHSLADCLGCPAGHEPAAVPGCPGLDAMELDAAAMLDQFRRRHGEELADWLAAVTYLDRAEAAAVTGLGLPGLDELMALGRMAELLETGRYRRMIWDPAPTGHTLRLLTLPDLLDGWVRFLAGLQARHPYVAARLAGGPAGEPAGDFLLQIKRTATRVRAALRDPARAAALVITVPEPVALAETGRLLAALADLPMNIRAVVANHWVDRPGPCPFCQARRAGQQDRIRAFRRRFPHLPVVPVPDMAEPVAGLDGLRRLLDAAGGCALNGHGGGAGP